jgi:hypothetical protein
MMLSLALLLAPTYALAQRTTTHTLAQQRADAALRVVTQLTAQYRAGTASIDDVAAWAARLYRARSDTGITGAALVKAAQDFVDETRALEQLANRRVQTGMATSVEADKATFYRLEAEANLARVRHP